MKKNSLFQNIKDFLDQPQTKITFMFLICQFLALLYLFSLIFFSFSEPESFQNLIILETKEDIFIVSVLFIYVLLIAFVNLLFFKIFRSVLLLKIFEFFSIFFPISLFFLPLFYIITLDIIFSFILSFILGFMVAVLKYFFVELKNILVVVSAATVGILIGLSLGFFPLIVFCILLSIYDYLAVFKTKHMLKLAEMVSSYNLAFSVSYPLSTNLKNKSTKNFSFLEANKNKEKLISKNKTISLSLGSGDFFVPASLIPPVYFEFGKLPIVFLMLFSTLTLYLLLRFTIKHKVVLPALPPLCLGSFLGILIGIIFENIFV